MRVLDAPRHDPKSLWRRPCVTTCLAVVLAIAIGCSQFWGMVAEAPCPGVTVAQLRELLESDASLTITRDFDPEPYVSEDGRSGARLHVWCTRGGANLTVAMCESPAEVSVTAQRGVASNASDDAQLAENLEHLTSRISDAYPNVGPWEVTDSRGGNPWCFWSCVGGWLSVMLFGLGGAWRARRRAKKRAPAEVDDAPQE